MSELPSGPHWFPPFGELIGQMSSAHGEGEDEIQGKQRLRSCRKPNSICEALERNLGEAECCIASLIFKVTLAEHKYYVACFICSGWPILRFFKFKITCVQTCFAWWRWSNNCHFLPTVRKNSIHREKHCRDVKPVIKRRDEKAEDGKRSTELPSVS